MEAPTTSPQLVRSFLHAYAFEMQGYIDATQI